MSIIATLRARCRHFLRGIFRRDQVERELGQELDGYLDMLVDQKLAEGSGAASGPWAEARALR